MAEITKIQWCHHTFNPWRGCTKVSPGCANCYAEKLSKRNPVVLGEWGPDGKRAIAAESYWKQPRQWSNDAARAGELGGFKNVWMGVSVEDQERADQRIPILLTIAAKIRFLSCEPLLGPLKLTNWLSPPSIFDFPRGYSFGAGQPVYASYDDSDPDIMSYTPMVLDWVIIGGESGINARPCDIRWIRDIIQQCRCQPKAAIFVKQLGANIKGLVQDSLDHDKIASILGSQ